MPHATQDDDTGIAGFDADSYQEVKRQMAVEPDDDCDSEIELFAPGDTGPPTAVIPAEELVRYEAVESQT